MGVDGYTLGYEPEPPEHRLDDHHLEILRLIAGIDEFKGAWRALGAIAPARLQALRKVASTGESGDAGYLRRIGRIAEYGAAAG
jgi:hypothetical protein